MKRFLWTATLACILLGAAFAAEMPRVRIPVRAVDSRGQIVLGLKADNFLLQLDGAAVKPVFFLGDESPVLIVLAMDTTRELESIEAVRRELGRFAGALPPGVQLMVMTLNGGLKVVQNNTADPALLAKAIQNFEITGYPGFMENVPALMQNLDRLYMKNPIRVAALVISDSDVRRYRHSYTSSDLRTAVEQILDGFGQACVPLHIIRLPVPDASDTMNRTYEGALRELARATGGDAEFCLESSAIPAALAGALHRIHATCVLGVNPEGKPGREFRIQLDAVDKGGKPLEGKVETRKGFRLPK